MEHEELYEQVLNDSEEHTFTFSYKPIVEHFKEIIKSYPKQIPQAITVFISIWAIAEIFLLDDKSNIKDVILPAIVLSIIVSFYNCIKNYREKSPEVILDENNTKIKKIFFQQKLGWQYALAKEMIDNRISESEFTLLRIRQNAEYIVPRKVSEDDFIEFVKIQPEKIVRLIDAVKIECIHYLPNAISLLKDGKDYELIILKKEVENIAKLYTLAVEYEKSIFEIIPSDEYLEVHEYMKGWTDPIRDGIRQLIALLDRLSSIKRKEFKNLKGIIHEYKIVFDPPKNLDLFNEAIEKMSNS